MSQDCIMEEGYKVFSILCQVLALGLIPTISNAFFCIVPEFVFGITK